jgi:virulence-associated protein VapD
VYGNNWYFYGFRILEQYILYGNKSDVLESVIEELGFESRSGEVYLIQHCMIKFVSDLRQVSAFLRLLWFPPSIKLTATI